MIAAQASGQSKVSVKSCGRSEVSFDRLASRGQDIYIDRAELVGFDRSVAGALLGALTGHRAVRCPAA